MKILLTSGGTKTHLDEVRSITNMSQGTFGNHICHALLQDGHEVLFLYAAGSKCPHEFRVDLFKASTSTAFMNLARAVQFHDRWSKIYTPVSYRDFDQYKKDLESALVSFKPDITILAAAVSDYAPIKREGKIRSDLRSVTLELEATPKLIRQVKALAPNTFLVGFKLLVNSTAKELKEAMENQMKHSQADMVVGNDLRDIKASNHKLTLLRKDGSIDELDPQPGDFLARDLVNCIMLEALEAQAKQGE